MDVALDRTSCKKSGIQSNHFCRRKAFLPFLSTSPLLHSRTSLYIHCHTSSCHLADSDTPSRYHLSLNDNELPDVIAVTSPKFLQPHSPFKWHIAITTTRLLTYKILCNFTRSNTSLLPRVWSSYRHIFSLSSSHSECCNDVGRFLNDSFQCCGAGPRCNTYMSAKQQHQTLTYLTGNG